MLEVVQVKVTCCDAHSNVIKPHNEYLMPLDPSFPFPRLKMAFDRERHSVRLFYGFKLQNKVDIVEVFV